MSDHEGQPLQLEGDSRPDRRRAHPYAHYVPIYGTKERALKGWNAIGMRADPPDLPPFDDPPEMVLWWKRRMSHSVPPKLLLAARRVRDSEAAVAPVVATPGAGDTPPAAPGGAPSRPVVSLDDIEGIDLAESVRRIRKALALAQRQWEETLMDPKADEATLSLRADRVAKITEQLRKNELAAQKLDEDAGRLIAASDMKREVGRLMESLASSLVPALLETGMPRARAVLFADRWFKQLRESRFGLGVPDAPAPVAA